MREIWAIACCLVLTGAASAGAQSGTPRHTFTIGTEISHLKYEEPGVMETQGVMYGVLFSYSYRRHLVLKAEGKLAYGQLDYDGAYRDETPLTIDNIPYYLWEGRGAIGYDIAIQGTVLTPYAGIGYRWLNDHAQRKHPSGYERESNYFYLPLGLEMVTRLGKGWSLGATAEYDLFLWGRQVSYLSDFDPGYNDVKNNQTSGYGLRGAIHLSKQGARVGWTMGPFINYWDIDRSDLAVVTYRGIPRAFAFEPKNRSTEIGFRLAIVF